MADKRWRRREMMADKDGREGKRSGEERKRSREGRKRSREGRKLMVQNVKKMEMRKSGLRADGCVQVTTLYHQNIVALTLFLSYV